jgi:hypothetical protein
MVGAKKPAGGDKMSTLSIRITESHKTNLSDAAKRAGLIRMDEGEPTGNVSALIGLIAQAVPRMSEAEIKALLFKDKSESA